MKYASVKGGIRNLIEYRRNGGSGETRTRDQRIKSPLLYRLSYRPSIKLLDSNLTKQRSCQIRTPQKQPLVNFA